VSVGAGLYMYDVVAKKLTFVVSSPDEFLSASTPSLLYTSVQIAGAQCFFRANVTTVRPMLRDLCPVCLYVTLVYRGQTVGWIKMPLGMEVGGRPRPRRHCVRWGPSFPHGKGHSSPYTFRPTCMLWHGRPSRRPSQQLLRSC